MKCPGYEKQWRMYDGQKAHVVRQFTDRRNWTAEFRSVIEVWAVERREGFRVAWWDRWWDWWDVLKRARRTRMLAVKWAICRWPWG
jgi:hypothetical protein